VGRFLFLLRVLLVAAFGAALLHLVERAGPGVARWEMALALVILGFVWIYNVEGRALDAPVAELGSGLLLHGRARGCVFYRSFSTL